MHLYKINLKAKNFCLVKKQHKVKRQMVNSENIFTT